MRLPRALGTLALAGLLLSARAQASEPPTPPAASAPAPATPADTEVARHHFKQGIKLYKDANYTGALAEFEAAYAVKPGPGSLQNIALCQKALFRYAEAADALTRLLSVHAAELSAGERTSAQLARDELEALVGSISLRVVPLAARVELDGKTLLPSEREAPLRVNVGEHTLVAEAPGYARITTNLRVASGQRAPPIELTLQPIAGFLEVRASDPAAVIAIDGRPLALGRFSGPVTPDEDHLIQVYRQGFEPFQQRVRVELGKTVIVDGQLGHARAGETAAPAPAPGELPAPPGTQRARGWYVLGALSLYATNARPFDFDDRLAESSAAGLGVRAGRRLWPSMALEGLLELGQLRTKGACDKDETRRRGATCADSDRVRRSYDLGWARVGPVFRLMNASDRVRVVAGMGTGVVWHSLELDGLDGTAGSHTQGVDPYFLLELGVAANWRHVLFGLDLVGIVDGTRGLDTRSGETAFEKSGRTLAWFGLGLRVGYSQWAPPP